MNETIKIVIAEYLSPEKESIVLDDNMELQADLGLSSLDMMTIIYLIEEKTKTKVAFDKLAGVHTLGQLCEVFSQHE
jgi:acyl carrier protein